MSEEYPMLCGIHQGGFLSLIKYISFINSLLIQLKQSGLCCTVMRIQTTPLGYADDLATCTLSGNRMKQVLGIVEKHGQTWRYSFNAGKSAIMVYGESKRETAIGSEHRMFSLGEKRVKETGYYDHVGIKACLKGDTHIRTEEKVKKARKVLNMATCMGIKRGGLNMATCCLIYWTVVIPTLCFGCEIWILKQRDIAMLVGFQKYAAKRIQRFHPRAYNATSTVCLGWLHIVRFINVKKILFIRTIFAMDDRIPIKQVFKQKVERHLEGELPVANPYDSPINDLINVCHRYGMMGHMTDFINGRMISKSKWRELAWRAAWVEELDEWGTKVHETQALSLVSKITNGPAYSVWWEISDADPTLVRVCEIMVKLLCKSSMLKGDLIRLRRGTVAERMCVHCNLGAIEDATHLIMQCPAQTDVRTELYNRVSAVHPQIEQQEYFDVIMGKHIDGWDYIDMQPIWTVSCQLIARMYYRATRVKEGVG